MDSNHLIYKITVLDRESRDLHRKVLKSIYVKLRGATLNYNDAYQLSDLYMPLLSWRWGGGENQLPSTASDVITSFPDKDGGKPLKYWR